MAKDNTKWVRPERILSLEKAGLIKIGSTKNPRHKTKNIYTPEQFRKRFWINAWQYNKYFYKLFDKKKILITGTHV